MFNYLLGKNINTEIPLCMIRILRQRVLKDKNTPFFQGKEIRDMFLS